MNKVRPLLLLMVVAVIPVVILAGVFGQYLIGKQKQYLDGTIENRARTLAAALDRELDVHVQLLNMLAESPRLDPPIARSAFAEVTRRVQARTPAWDSIKVASIEGKTVLSYPSHSDAEGTDVIDDDESYRKIVASKQPIIGNMVGGAAGHPGFRVRVPIVRSGKTVAILSAIIRPSAIADALYFDGLPQSWHAWLSDAHGNVVSSTGPESVAGKPLTDFVSVLDPRSVSIADGKLVSGESVRIVNETLTHPGWSIRVAMPTSEYESLSRQTYTLIGVTSAFALILSVAALLLFLREAHARRQHEHALTTWQRMDALGKLTGQVAHDFNNLLMVFSAGVSGMERKPEDVARRAQIIETMRAGVERGTEITRRLLSFSSKSNQGSEPIAIGAFVKGFEPLMRQAANDSVIFDVDFPERLWELSADPKALETALINIVSNSREAMPEGGRITIRARNVQRGEPETRSRPGEYVAIVIADTGQGIAPEHLERAFDPFFTTKVGSGSGLGLTQVYSFAQRSGGFARISSLIGLGTSVTIYLPRCAHDERAYREGEGTKLPRCLLIVDDTPATLEAAKMSVDDPAVEVLLAGGADEALRLLQDRQDIEGLLSDIMMPGMSGIELAAAARKLNPRIRIVLMTGYSDVIERGEVVDLPILRKPFGPVDITEAFSSSGAHKRSTVVPFRSS